MSDLTVKEINKLKNLAELKMASALSNIFEQFKADSGIFHADQSIYVRVEYAQEFGQQRAEGVVTGVEIDMKVFE